MNSGDESPLVEFSFSLFNLIISMDREIQVPLAHQEKLVQSAPRESQGSPGLKVSEDFQDQWSVFD